MVCIIYFLPNILRINFLFVLKTASWQSQQVPLQRTDKIDQNDIEQSVAGKGTATFSKYVELF